ncbi:ribose transport system ATP-binding protein [Actinopolyspora xinjiangensis]|uniref:Ribose transport system ATP-binding protein n=1 Tax=Actinopolyspora xinjiangensis TaxID=405564 RepID=A0A1H0QS39_9ACTN|nr:sugar ABC transporter ATP-binding protein [Actinopolyspora xinjiangensis]SDP19559.1 ribose transport system ATP-binding protein [Actinopolyspora xinjiangensis]
MDAAPPLVELRGITKRFGGVLACSDVNLTVRAGEVHALLGENGAGKSTLMRVLSGDVTDHSGEIRVRGEPVAFRKPLDAQRAGIAMIQQELDLVPALSVAENLHLGREPRTARGTVDRRRMNARTRELLRHIGVDLDPRRQVGLLRIGEQQLVTVARALALRARVLIMDEPTSALSGTEVDRLFSVISELRGAGTGVVYISHRMDEIGEVADRATVLRNGGVAAEFDARSVTAEQAAAAMVGEEVDTTSARRHRPPGEELLSVSGLGLRSGGCDDGRREPAGIDLSVRGGEVVGLCGLLGSGRTELLEALFGSGPSARWYGQVRLNGRAYCPRSPGEALRAGVAFVPEDRRGSGLTPEHSVTANTVLSVLPRLGPLGLVSRRRERSVARRSSRRLGIKLGSIADPVGTLSGGNQQKVVFGRMLLTEPRLLLLDDPTRGVDIAAKAELYRLLDEVAEQGIGVLLASSELAELVGVCSRIVVLRGGASVAEFDASRTTQAELLTAAMGSDPDQRDSPTTSVGGGR